MVTDAVVVGAGPNGLAAAIELARSGCSVLVIEARATIGGGCRTAELTLPGFLHDVCSAVHPLALGSPFLSQLPLADYGLELVSSPAAVAQPLDDGTAVVLERSVSDTARQLERDADAYRRLFEPLVEHAAELIPDVLAPLRMPRHPLLLARFGIHAIRSARGLATSTFVGEHARALFGGVAAHSMLPLDRPITAAFGLLLNILGHADGWPIVRGGSHRVTDAMAAYFKSLGGTIATGWNVTSLDELPRASAILLDVTPRQVLSLACARLPQRYARLLAGYRYGPGVCKVDWALDGPVPWRAEGCQRAATVHLGGRLSEIAAGEAAVWRGEHPSRPFVLFVQPTLFDASRAPRGKHTAWAYCHVPSGSSRDMSPEIEAQVERFAPGFRDRILARHVSTAVDVEAYNPNYVGGDINGGVQDLAQHFFRPVARAVPYRTPARGLYLCSSATPPGGGVHGMCGYFAARAALAEVFR